MTKLLIRHLPSFFTREDTESFLRSFGSIDVRTFDAKGKMKYCAFATFADELACSVALHSLHQLKLCNTRLVVEFAKEGQAIEPPAKEACNRDQLNGDRSNGNQFDKDQYFSQLHAISSKFRINHPISPLLRYNYPPASAPILRNIAKALANCPALYTQVLHLMNKMNLPPPFINTDYEFDEQRLPKSFLCKVVKLNSETSESELEDEDTGGRKTVEKTKSSKQDEAVPKKRRIRQRIEEASKKLKSGSFGRPDDSCKAQGDGRKVGEYFDDYADVRQQRQISGKVKLKAKPAETANRPVDQGFGRFTSQVTTDRPAERTEATREAEATEATEQTDSLRQLTESELSDNPVFRDYSIGEPSCRLYVKNVHKQVTERRLASVFARLLGLTDDSLSVNLFKKGKMNGQAFVSLPSEQLARQAIEKSNGLLLEKKPIVVCFARSIKAKE